MISGQLVTREHTLNLGVQNSLNISEDGIKKIINYIKMVSKGPEDFVIFLKRYL